MELELLTNHRKILDTVRRFGPIPRSEITQHIDLTPGPVTRLSKELLAKGLLREDARRGGTRGQPALPLALNPDGGYSFGVTFRLRHVEVVCSNLLGQVVARRTAKVDTNKVTEVVSSVKDSVETILGTFEFSKERILGAGIATPGFFAPSANTIQTPDLLEEWRGKDIAELFTTALGMPTWIDNVGNCGALAEYFSQRWRETRNLVLLHLGYGVGGGLILNGQLFRGTSGNAGEIGGLFPYGAPRPSALDLLETIRNSGSQVDTFEDLKSIYDTEDPVFEDWIERAVAQLTMPITAATWWLEPEAVVIGGVLPQQINQRIVEKIIQKNLFSEKPMFKSPVIVASQFGPIGSAMGAAFLPFQKLCLPNFEMGTEIVMRRK